jgi:hypothetical protein
VRRAQFLGRLVIVGALGALGCRDLERFDTKPGEAYCGSIIAGFTQQGFISGRPRLRMRLELDTDNLSTLPGTLSTDIPEDGLCGTEPIFNGSKLRAIEAVFHDPLSFIEFGEGRDHNFFAWADSACLQTTLLAVVSLMRNDDVELRLLKPKPEAPPDAPEVDKAGFGVFHLQRQAGSCGF